jgi:hypothetical protein
MQEGPRFPVSLHLSDYSHFFTFHFIYIDVNDTHVRVYLFPILNEAKKDISTEVPG